MRRPHIRIAHSGHEHVRNASKEPNETPAPADHAGSQKSDADAEELRKRIEQIRRSVADGRFLTRQTAEETARRLRESGDL